jgi:integrase
VYQKLIAPRYDKYKTSYLSLILRTLKQCFGIAAHRVSHKLPDWQFSQYSKVRVLPKIAAFNPSQISVVIANIKAEPRPWLRVMAAWCLLYAVRVSECCVLTWRLHIDAQQRIYRIPADVTKNKKAHQLPLTDVALDVLAAYRRSERDRGRRSDRLLPARRNAWRAINTTYASNLLSDMLKTGSCHDLRKLARAWLMENDVDNYVGRLILNQRQHVLDDTYVQQLLKDKSRAALDMWHARLVDAGLLDALAL